MSLDAAEHARIFRERIVPREFAGAVPATTPTVVLMGGQPGSGKSGLLDAAERELSTPEAPSVQVVGDDLRDYHPAYQELLRVDDLSAAAQTDADAGRWVQLCLEHARRVGCSVVVEGTMRRPEVPLATARAFRDAGYQVEAWVMAVDPLSSRLGILARYHAQREAFGVGRFTVDAAHDAAVVGMLDSLDTVQDAGVVDRFRIMRRGPHVIADVPGTATASRLRAVVEQERTRAWTTAELTAFQSIAENVDRLVPAGHEHHRLLEDLQAQARSRSSAAVDPAWRAAVAAMFPHRQSAAGTAPAPGDGVPLGRPPRRSPSQERGGPER